MSLFQCEECGCCENTALCNYHWRKCKKMPLVCSECDTDTSIGGAGKWHGEFPKVMLPKGEFITDHEGNLAHRKTGDTNFRKFAVAAKPDEGNPT